MPHKRYRTILAALVLMGAGCALVNDNLRQVEPGELWRSAQMSRGRLEYVIAAHGIQTVINLRGVQPGEQWYQDEVATCGRLGVAHHDLPLTMKQIPDPESLEQLVQWFETADKPILVHCQAGIHRAGVASASYQLFKGCGVDEARKQFGLFFDHAPIGALLDLYQGSDKPFAEWVRTDYPKVYEAHLTAEKANRSAP